MSIFAKCFGAAAILAVIGNAAQAQQPVIVNVGMPNAATDVGYFVAHKKGYFWDLAVFG